MIPKRQKQRASAAFCGQCPLTIRTKLSLIATRFFLPGIVTL